MKIKQMCCSCFSISCLKKVNTGGSLERLSRSAFIVDNARPHCAFNMKRFLTKHDIVELNHPLYSPDLSPPNFYFYPKFKTALKGHQFQNVGDIQKNVIAELRSISSEDCEMCF